MSQKNATLSDEEAAQLCLSHKNGQRSYLSFVENFDKKKRSFIARSMNGSNNTNLISLPELVKQTEQTKKQKEEKIK